MNSELCDDHCQVKPCVYCDNEELKDSISLERDKVRGLEQQCEKFCSSIVGALDQLEMFNFAKEEQRVYNADTALRKVLSTYKASKVANDL